MPPTAHLDTFARDHLPAPELQPEFLFDLPELLFPATLNCAAALLDAAIARGWGERSCILAPGGVRWTYAVLQAQANRIANVLVHELGLVPGNRVLLRAPNNPMLAACWFAVVKAGGIAVATMPLLRASELEKVITKAQVSHALCDVHLADELAAAAALCPVLQQVLHFDGTGPALDTSGRSHMPPQGDQFQVSADRRPNPPIQPTRLEPLMARHSADFTAVATAADDTCLIAFTSGTTGAPKGTMHFHRDVMAACACWPLHVLRARADDIFIGSPPLAFTFGLGGLLLFPMRVGAATVLLEKASPAALLEGIAQHGATVLFTAPTSYRAMALEAGARRLSAAQGGRLVKCVSAGEVLPAATRALWLQHTGIPLIDGIGATEMLHIFISADAASARPGATGRVVPGYVACVLGEDGLPVATGTIGHLAVKGPTGCRYLADERQAKYVVNGWNLTGDAYFCDAEGYFHYCSRTDDMIISAGYNIAAPEVEEALLTHPAVAECAVVGLADEERGQIVQAFVVLRDGHGGDAAMTRALQDFVKQAIAPYKYPRAVAYLAQLPRTETGKVQRFKLKSIQPQDRPADRPTDRTPMTASQALLPPGWPRPKGYANGVLAPQGRTVFVAGMIGWDAQGRFASDRLADQARVALANVLAVLAEAGAGPQHIARMTWYVTSRRDYIDQGREIGAAFRELIGSYTIAMSAVEVAALMEDAAKVEIEATAVIPG